MFNSIQLGSIAKFWVVSWITHEWFPESLMSGFLNHSWVVSWITHEWFPESLMSGFLNHSWVGSWITLCCAVLCLASNHGMHAHCGLGQLSPLPTSGDDKWVAAKHCGRAKRSRISDTHRLRSSLQFRYINNQSLLFTFTHEWFPESLMSGFLNHSGVVPWITRECATVY